MALQQGHTPLAEPLNFPGVQPFWGPLLLQPLLLPLDGAAPQQSSVALWILDRQGAGQLRCVVVGQALHKPLA